MIHKCFITLLFCFSLNTYANTPNYVSSEVLTGLDNIKFAFELGYAPTEWKATQSDWSLETEVQKAKASVSNKDFKTIYDYHKIISSFFKSTNDYHVSVGLLTTLASKLPFTVKAAEDDNRYFVAHIEKEKLSNPNNSLAVGDEIINFGNKPVQNEIDFILSESSTDVPLTDRTYASLLLTSRKASNALTVPRGPIDITIRKKGTKVIKNIQLIWEHTPEKIHLGSGNINPLPFLPNTTDDFFNRPRVRKNMALPAWKYLNDEESTTSAEKEVNPHQLGGKTSFIPKLGEVIWEADSESSFSAYMYKSKSGKLIGYVRIPHYGSSDAEFTQFKDIIERFKKVTDGLVIDQVNNPGGSVFYLYALASVLTDQPLIAPRHRIKIKQETINESVKGLTDLKDVKDNESARKALGETWDGYPVDYQVAIFTKQFYQFIIDQWTAGKTLSDPIFLYAADKILPDPKTNYTKPILVLTNSLDFSGGDFFPAILQDNKRATILGTRTAGAGGYVEEFTFPNRIGISSMSMTGSIALRVNQKPIENLGVTPDIIYPISADDLENNYKKYVKKIQKEINRLVK